MLKWITPKVAIIIVCIFIGRPDIIDDLTDICHRESRCTPVTAHAIDRHISSREWFGQVHWKHLDPECQKRKAEGGWATHGIAGLSAGAHWKYVPPCYQPSVFDNIFVSSLVAARKYVRTCWMQNKRHGWCHVKKKSRRNNLESPRLKEPPRTKRPSNWVEFVLRNPW